MPYPARMTVRCLPNRSYARPTRGAMLFVSLLTSDRSSPASWDVERGPAVIFFGQRRHVFVPQPEVDRQPLRHFHVILQVALVFVAAQIDSYTARAPLRARRQSQQEIANYVTRVAPVEGELAAFVRRDEGVELGPLVRAAEIQTLSPEEPRDVVTDLVVVVAARDGRGHVAERVERREGDARETSIDRIAAGARDVELRGEIHGVVLLPLSAGGPIEPEFEFADECRAEDVRLADPHVLRTLLNEEAEAGNRDRAAGERHEAIRLIGVHVVERVARKPLVVCAVSIVRLDSELVAVIDLLR